jgi:hypothetical protein
MTDGERSESQPAAAPPVLDELRSLVERARRGEAAALPPLRRLLDAHPEVWRRAGDLARHVEAAWVDLLAGDDPMGREVVRRRAEQLRRELASPGAPAAEALLADLAVANWLEVQHSQHAQVCGANGATGPAAARLRRSESAQRRFLAAVKALTTLQGLAPGRLRLPTACTSTAAWGRRAGRPDRRRGGACGMDAAGPGAKGCAWRRAARAS